LNIEKIHPDTPMVQGFCSTLWGKKNNNNNHNPKQSIVKLFEPNRSFPDAIYRTTESGSAEASNAEPKKSWETRRCSQFFTTDDGDINVKDATVATTTTSSTISSDNNSTTQQEQPPGPNALKDVTCALHSVITTVSSILLRLPNNLLAQESNQYDSNCSSWRSCSCQCTSQDQQHTNNNIINTTNQNPCNVDLLRVFYYDVVPQQQGHDPILGSSPHTDWGSWTVVWQDHVGGLQTWCSDCQNWQTVEAQLTNNDNNDDDDDNNNLVRFVIHVGDTTSLALAHAATAVATKPITSSTSNTTSTNTTTRTTTTVKTKATTIRNQPDIQSNHFFPSPKHRVLSPISEPRVSLVYFAYPPPGESLESLSRGLEEWIQQQQQQKHHHHHHHHHHHRYDQQQRDGHGNDEENAVRKVVDCIPYYYDRYYLLHDQSSRSPRSQHEQHTKTAQQVFHAIYSRPLDQVFAEKWQQVQRA